VKPYFNVTTSPDYYKAYVIIKFTCLANTSRLILHKTESTEIVKSSFEVLNLNQTHSGFIPIRNLDSRYFIDQWSYDAERQFFIVEFAKQIFIRGHNYSVAMEFNGAIKDDNNGFYKSSYVYDSKGTKHWLAVTDFEP
jgi:hypothetical protein